LPSKGGNEVADRGALLQPRGIERPCLDGLLQQLRAPWQTGIGELTAIGVVQQDVLPRLMGLQQPLGVLMERADVIAAKLPNVADRLQRADDAAQFGVDRRQRCPVAGLGDVHQVVVALLDQQRGSQQGEAQHRHDGRRCKYEETLAKSHSTPRRIVAGCGGRRRKAQLTCRLRRSQGNCDRRLQRQRLAQGPVAVLFQAEVMPLRVQPERLKLAG
jgi:hypothetical protein